MLASIAKMLTPHQPRRLNASEVFNALRFAHEKLKQTDLQPIGAASVDEANGKLYFEDSDAVYIKPLYIPHEISLLQTGDNSLSIQSIMCIPQFQNKKVILPIVENNHITYYVKAENQTLELSNVDINQLIHFNSKGNYRGFGAQAKQGFFDVNTCGYQVIANILDLKDIAAISLQMCLAIVLGDNAAEANQPNWQKNSRINEALQLKRQLIAMAAFNHRANQMADNKIMFKSAFIEIPIFLLLYFTKLVPILGALTIAVIVACAALNYFAYKAQKTILEKREKTDDSAVYSQLTESRDDHGIASPSEEQRPLLGSGPAASSETNTAAHMDSRPGDDGGSLAEDFTHAGSPSAISLGNGEDI